MAIGIDVCLSFILRSKTLWEINGAPITVLVNFMRTLYPFSRQKPIPHNCLASAKHSSAIWIFRSRFPGNFKDGLRVFSGASN
jgi:hypothetical protein